MIIGGIPISVLRKDIKNLHLGVYPPHGRVRIAAPMRFTDEAIRVFAVSKIPWIKNQKVNFKGQERQTKREYVSGESHYFMGRKYILKVIYVDAPPKIELSKKTYIKLFVRPKSSHKKRREIVTEWYRKELKKEIPPLIEKWEKKIGVKVADWGVKKMSTRWGTCNLKAKRIWLNLELVKKTKRCLDFIVHILERSHNDHFKALMDKHMPKWKACRDELNRLPLCPD